MTDETVLAQILNLSEADRNKLYVAVEIHPDVPRLLNNKGWKGACKACLEELIHGNKSSGAWRKTNTWTITKHAIVQTYKERYRSDHPTASRSAVSDAAAARRDGPKEKIEEFL